MGKNQQKKEFEESKELQEFRKKSGIAAKDRKGRKESFYPRNRGALPRLRGRKGVATVDGSRFYPDPVLHAHY